jgi:hypothetical protein
MCYYKNEHIAFNNENSWLASGGTGGKWRLVPTAGTAWIVVWDELQKRAVGKACKAMPHNVTAKQQRVDGPFIWLQTHTHMRDPTSVYWLCPASLNHPEWRFIKQMMWASDDL